MLRYQIEYAAWANRRVLTAASDLTAEELARDFKSSEHSIAGTLAHIYRAERAWLARLQGAPVEFAVAGDETLTALVENWPRLSQQWIDWSLTMTDETSQRELNYTDLRGNKWAHPIWKIVLHVVNHSTHHRGQAIGFLRALGRTPPNVDSIMFARAGN